MAMRLIVPLVAYVAQLTSLKYIPITTFTVIFSTNPFITTLLASCFFSLTVSPIEIVAMIVCFACVVTVVSAKGDTTEAIETTSLLEPLFGMVLAFAPAIAYSIQGLLAYKMRPLHFTVQLFYVALGFILVSICTSIFQLLFQGTTDFLHLDNEQLGFLIIIAFGMCFENLFSTLAFTYGSP